MIPQNSEQSIAEQLAALQQAIAELKAHNRQARGATVYQDLQWANDDAEQAIDAMHTALTTVLKKVGQL